MVLYTACDNLLVTKVEMQWVQGMSFSDKNIVMIRKVLIRNVVHLEGGGMVPINPFQDYVVQKNPQNM